MKWLLNVLVILLVGCSVGEQPNDQNFYVFSYTYNFSESVEGWSIGFTDFSAKDSSEYKFDHAIEPLPSYLSPFDYSPTCIFLGGNDLTGGLFLFLKRKIDGLKPNTPYSVAFSVELASEADSPTLITKAGASPREPKVVLEDSRYVLNIDKGYSGTSGRDMVVIDPTRGYNDENHNGEYANGDTFEVKSNADGEVWLIIGTESLEEGKVGVYFKKINAIFSAEG